MKIIALFPIKNDSWILRTTIPQLKLFADEILCLDGGSTDETVEILKSFGVQVRPQDQTNVNYSSWRQTLLDWGRERGGTHFIWLDSDEAFITNLLPNFKNEIAKLKPGQKLVMQWLCLWKSPYEYRDDKSVWSNLYKDFVFCDDKTSSFGNVLLHEGRTPGINNENTWVKIPPSVGAVLHFQFVPFERFQMKQAFQRCRELIMGNSPRKINLRYSETMDTPLAKTKPIPKEWISGIENLDNISSLGHGWFYDAILKFFSDKGVSFFEPVQIWHINELKSIFVKETGRQPKPSLYPQLLVSLNKVRHFVKNRITKLFSKK